MVHLFLTRIMSVTHTHTLVQQPVSETTSVNCYQNVQPFWTLLQQETIVQAVVMSSK